VESEALFVVVLPRRGCAMHRMTPVCAGNIPALAHTSSLHPAALASVPYGIVLVRVRVLQHTSPTNNSRHGAPFPRCAPHCSVPHVHRGIEPRSILQNHASSPRVLAPEARWLMTAIASGMCDYRGRQQKQRPNGSRPDVPPIAEYLPRSILQNYASSLMIAAAGVRGS